MNSQGNNDGVEKARSAPQLCQKGCGFFQNGGGLYCSKCAKAVAQDEEKQRVTEVSVENIAASLQASKALSEKPAVSVPEASTPVEVPEPASPSCSAQAVSVSTGAQEGSTPPPNPNRCFQCRKKTGLTGFKCKCSNVFCGQHRLAECHNCPFDYKTTQRAQLAEANPVVQAAKVQKI